MPYIMYCPTVSLEQIFLFNSFQRYSFSVFGINSVNVLNNLIHDEYTERGVTGDIV